MLTRPLPTQGVPLLHSIAALTALLYNIVKLRHLHIGDITCQTGMKSSHQPTFFGSLHAASVILACIGGNANKPRLLMLNLLTESTSCFNADLLKSLQPLLTLP